MLPLLTDEPADITSVMLRMVKPPATQLVLASQQSAKFKGSYLNRDFVKQRLPLAAAEISECRPGRLRDDRARRGASVPPLVREAATETAYFLSRSFRSRAIRLTAVVCLPRAAAISEAPTCRLAKLSSRCFSSSVQSLGRREKGFFMVPLPGHQTGHHSLNDLGVASIVVFRIDNVEDGHSHQCGCKYFHGQSFESIMYLFYICRLT